MKPIISMVILLFFLCASPVFGFHLIGSGIVSGNSACTSEPSTSPTLNTGHPLATNLEAIWLINEATGTTVNDYSGNGYDGTITGATWSTCGSDNCLYFDADTEEVATTYDGVLGANDRTVFAVITTDTSLPADSNSGTVVSWGNSGATAGTRWELRVDSDNSYVLRTEVNGGYEIGSTSLTTSTTYSVGQVFSGTDVEGVVHYLDGSAETSGGSSNVTINTSDVVDVQVSDNSTATARYFAGYIHLVYIWSRALSAAEIASLHSNPYQMFTCE